MCTNDMNFLNFYSMYDGNFLSKLGFESDSRSELLIRNRVRNTVFYGNLEHLLSFLSIWNEIRIQLRIRIHEAKWSGSTTQRNGMTLRQVGVKKIKKTRKQLNFLVLTRDFSWKVMSGAGRKYLATTTPPAPPTPPSRRLLSPFISLLKKYYPF